MKKKVLTIALAALALFAVPVNGSSFMTTVVQAASGNDTVSGGDVSADASTVDDSEDEDDEMDTVVFSDGESVESSVATKNTASVAIAVVTPISQIKVAGGVASDEAVEMYIENGVSERAQAVIESAAAQAGGTVVSVMEFYLNKTTPDGAVLGQLTDLEAPIEVKLSAPDSVDGNAYDFAMVRIHDGQTSILPDIDDDPTTITFLTDKFSAYAIIYGEKGSFDQYKTGAASAKAAGTAAKTGVAPKTGETLPMAVPACAVFVILAIGMGVYTSRKKES